MKRKREKDVTKHSIYPNKGIELQNLHPSKDMLFPQPMAIITLDEKVVGVKAR